MYKTCDPFFNQIDVFVSTILSARAIAQHLIKKPDYCQLKNGRRIKKE